MTVLLGSLGETLANTGERMVKAAGIEFTVFPPLALPAVT